MDEYVTREEFEPRVGVMEQEVEGDELVTRYMLEQTRRNGDDLAALKTRVDRVERKVDGLDRKLDGLVKSLPILMREVFAERHPRG